MAFRIDMDRIESRKAMMEVTLIDLIREIIKKWKIAITIILICSLCVPFLKYYRDLQDYNANNNNENIADNSSDVIDIDTQISAILASLEPGDRSKVEQLIRQDKWMREREDYYNHSVFSHVDINKCKSIHLGFIINGLSDTTYLAAIQRAYESMFDSDSYLQAINNKLGLDVEPQYVKDIITVDSSSYNATYYNDSMILDDSTDGVVDIVITYPNNLEDDSIQQLISNIMTDRHKEISSQIPHEISLIYTEYSNKASTEVFNKQQDLFSWNYNYQAWKYNMNAWLNDSQKAAYEQISKLISVTYDQSGSQMQMVAEKPTIRKKYIVLGCALGIILTMLLCTIQLLTNKKINSAEKAGAVTEARVIGAVIAGKGTVNEKGREKTSLYEKAFQRKTDSLDAQIVKIANRIRLQCISKKIDVSGMVCIGDNNALVDFATKVKNIVEKQGAKLELIAIKEESDIEQLIRYNNIVYAVSNNNTIEEVQSVVDACKDLEIESIGTLFFEEE